MDNGSGVRVLDKAALVLTALESGPATLAGLVALVAVLVLPAAAGAITPTIVNTGVVDGQPNWLEGNSMAVEQDGSGQADGRQIVLTALVKHDPGLSITALRVDDNYDGTDNTGTASFNKTPQSIQQPSIINGYDYSRATLTYNLPTSNSGSLGTSTAPWSMWASPIRTPSIRSGLTWPSLFMRPSTSRPQ